MVPKFGERGSDILLPEAWRLFKTIECAVQLAYLAFFLVAVGEFNIDDLVNVFLKEGRYYVHLLNL